MARGMGTDLVMRFEQAECNKSCVVPTDAQDSRRLRAAWRRGDLVSPAKDVYVRLSYWRTLKSGTRAWHIMRALATLHPDWVFCGPTAALAYGLSVSYSLLGLIHVATTSASHARDMRGIVRDVVERDEPSVAGGVRVTSIERTVFDCLRSLSFREGLAVVDAALRMKLTSKEQLRRYMLSHHKNMRGREQALKTLRYADGRAESGGESIARAVMIEHGFVLPDLQHPIDDGVDPNDCYYADFYWELPDGGIVIGELDGHEKYENPVMTGGRSVVQVLADERLRESRVSLTGAKIMRFSFADLLNETFFVYLLDTYGVPRVVPRQASEPPLDAPELRMLAMLRAHAYELLEACASAEITAA